MRDDLKTALRSLRQSPTFTSVALAVLALGIGSATALYSVVDAVVLRGLPFDEHDRLMVVREYETTRQTPFGGATITPQTYFDWRERQQSFLGLTAISNTLFRVRHESGEPGYARGLRVTHEFFPVFRAVPVLGRGLQADDEIDGPHRRVVISHAFWQRQFGGDPAVVGRTIDLNEEPYEIVGVMPRDFSYPVGSARPTDVYSAAVFRESDRVRATSRNFNWTIVGRLRPALSRAQAQDDMHRISEAIDREYPEWGPGRRALVITLHDHIVGTARGWMLMLLAAVGLLLLIACANVANLMLARATARGREVGIRAALGAGRWRMMRGLLVEGVVLAVCGGLIGVVIAYAAIQLLTAWLPANLPRVADVAINLRVLAGSLVAALLTGTLFGIVPALHAARADVASVLKEGGRSNTSGTVSHRLRNVLVVGEVAIAVVLLVGAGLFAGSFVQLIRIDPGFEYRNLLTLSVFLQTPPGLTPEQRTAHTARARAYVEQVFEAVERVPGVVAVTGVQEALPLTGSWSRTGLTLPGKPKLSDDDGSIDLNSVRANYFETMRVPVLRGRALAETDRENTELVAVLNQAAAQKYFPNEDPLGRRVIINSRERTVVGIVGNIRHLGLESPVRHAIFLPYTQQTTFGMNLAIRTATDPLTVLPAVKSAIWAINPEQRLTPDTVTMEGHLDRLLAERRFNMAMLVLFGVLGLVITAAGIYGVMAYIVEQRTTEIGVRMALGATPERVLSMVMQRAVLLMAIGVLVGGVAAWQLSATVRAFLFEVQPNDPRIFAAALAVLAVAGLLASAVPARRAARVEPVVALRQE